MQGLLKYEPLGLVDRDSLPDSEAEEKSAKKIDRYSRDYFDLIERYGRHVAQYLALDDPIVAARFLADARVQRIYGGTNEIMKELISRSLYLSAVAYLSWSYPTINGLSSTSNRRNRCALTLSLSAKC